MRVRLSICRDLYDTLSSDDLYYENKVYSSTLRRFLKAVYEDYALLSDCERERLIFADNIIKINEVIKQTAADITASFTHILICTAVKSAA